MPSPSSLTTLRELIAKMDARRTEVKNRLSTSAETSVDTLEASSLPHDHRTVEQIDHTEPVVEKTSPEELALISKHSSGRVNPLNMPESWKERRE